MKKPLLLGGAGRRRAVVPRQPHDHTPRLLSIAEGTSATAGVADVIKRNFD
jgi:hypothetical protein